VDTTLLEQYKAVIGDIGNIGIRYTTANRFYLSVMSAFVGVLALSESGKPPEEVNLPLVLVVSVFAMVICYIWTKTVLFYRALFGAKLQILGEMEKGLAFPAYAREFEIMKANGVAPLTDNERKVPLILWGFFAAVAAVSLVLMVTQP
jgi:hypothetical protein